MRRKLKTVGSIDSALDIVAQAIADKLWDELVVPTGKQQDDSRADHKLDGHGDGSQ